MVEHGSSGLTRDLVSAVHGSFHDRAALPGDVRDAAVRSLLNVIGTAIGASDDEAVRLAVAHGHAHGGEGTVPLLGRSELLDPLNAALVIGLAAHLDDFDDTHLATVIHPGAATLGALVAMWHDRRPSGEEALRAFALGCEAQLRVGVAMSPAHYDAGWHITGTCGTIGAAVTAGLLLGLDRAQLTDAIAIAASQTLGLRDAFGTMTKPFHPGRAASNGVLAARLAQVGFTGANDVLEHRQGFFKVLSDELDPTRVVGEWGTRWELLQNTFKPYPCGIVIHPVIDAAIDLHAQLHELGEVVTVEVRCNPLVVELTGRTEPQDGLEARFSAVHGVAVGLLYGAAGLTEFSDAHATAPAVVALRRRIRLVPDETMPRDAASIEVRTDTDARTSMVEHARGSLARPLTDHELAAKATDLIERRLPGRAATIVALVTALDTADGLDELLGAARPTDDLTRADGAGA